MQQSAMMLEGCSSTVGAGHDAHDGREERRADREWCVDEKKER